MLSWLLHKQVLSEKFFIRFSIDGTEIVKISFILILEKIWNRSNITKQTLRIEKIKIIYLIIFKNPFNDTKHKPQPRTLGVGQERTLQS